MRPLAARCCGLNVFCVSRRKPVIGIGVCPARGPLSAEAEAILERYYAIKVGSLQFCGPASFGLPFWEGFEALAVTLPAIRWVARMDRQRSREESITRALTVIDDHIGFNRVLAGLRQRLSFRILARTGELARLIAWYSR